MIQAFASVSRNAPSLFPAEKVCSASIIFLCIVSAHENPYALDHLDNVTVLLYHLVFPAKYRRAVFDKAVDGVLKEVY